MVSSFHTTPPMHASALYYAQGWTDSLPVVPPTRDKVQAMVERSRRTAGEVIAGLPPQGGKATVERIATNAVIAGCLLEYMPVMLTVLEVMLKARDLLTVVADCLSILGSNHMYPGGECFVVFSPEHAATIAASGWRKQNVRAFLYEPARQCACYRWVGCMALHGGLHGFGGSIRACLRTPGRPAGGRATSSSRAGARGGTAACQCRSRT
jgi:hypothetical protein